MEIANAIKETAKYCVKPLGLFLKLSDDEANVITIKDIIRELDSAFTGRRFRALGGEIKKIAKSLKFDDDEAKKDLIHNDDNGTVDAIWMEIYRYFEFDKDYYLIAREEISEECEQEQKKGNDFNDTG